MKDLGGGFVLSSVKRKINIAIDGPAGAGKSTISRLLANELNYIYVDTGAMYRSVALKAIMAGLSIEQIDAITRLTDRLSIQLRPSQQEQQVIVDDEDVTEAIRSAEVTQLVSHIAQIAEVRQLLVAKQKQMARHKGVVMDGRDIATDVLPDAELKIYLTASVQERARRRFKELSDPNTTLQQIEEAIVQRDALDTQRDISPLTIAEDAIVIDCSDLSISQVVNKLLLLSRTKIDGEQ